MAATSLPLGTLIAGFGVILGGLVGSAGWLTGGFRKSAAEARKDDIDALTTHNARIKEDLAAVRAELVAQKAATQVLITQARGDEQLAKLIELIRLQHAELVSLLKDKK